MGRQEEFNREETLTKAMEVFWQKGYKATSMKDLVKMMGIQPGSIYNSFGDKHTLFIEAVKYYGEVITTNAIKSLNSSGSPVQNIKNFFNEIINKPMDKQCRGCLIVNTVVELAPHDEEVAEIVRNILKNIQKAFYNCLQKAVDIREIPTETNIKALSRYFASSTHGLLVTGKSQTTQDELQDIVNVILSTLGNTNLIKNNNYLKLVDS